MVNLTLLMDLDDTLLGNRIDTFLPSYLQALARRLAVHAPPQQIIDSVLGATQFMLENQQPDRTLEQNFDSAFYTLLNLPKETLRPNIELFYAEDFPRLQSLTTMIPHAADVVAAVFSRGCPIAIATNPLFPLTAIQQRLAWAGFSPDEFPFHLISSFETFHFAKPEPAFFHECLARLGWPDGPAVVVGDNPLNDIAGARRAGLPAFQVGAQDAVPPTESEPAFGRGSLQDLIPWLDQLPEGALLPSFNAPEPALATLRSTPAALDSFRLPCTAEDWQRRFAPGEWNAIEIVCHLRDVDADINLPRLHKMLGQENPFLPGADPDRWTLEREYSNQSAPQALYDFICCRKEVLALLDSISPDQWVRTARHAIFGPTTLLEMVTIMAGHDRLHIRQLLQTLGKLPRCE